MTIDIERLHHLIDLGEAARTADTVGRTAHIEAQTALREARAEIEPEITLTMQKAVVAGLNKDSKGQQAQTARADALTAELAALESRVERRAAALPRLQRTAALWSAYLADIRAYAKQHGVIA